jgi:hypothetical protein
MRLSLLTIALLLDGALLIEVFKLRREGRAAAALLAPLSLLEWIRPRYERRSK